MMSRQTGALSEPTATMTDHGSWQLYPNESCRTLLACTTYPCLPALKHRLT